MDKTIYNNPKKKINKLKKIKQLKKKNDVYFKSYKKKYQTSKIYFIF